MKGLLDAFIFIGECAFIYFGSLVVFGVLVGGLLALARWVGRKARPPGSDEDDAVRDGSSNVVFRARMKRLAKPTLLLIPAKVPGFSKLGGVPELPNGMNWPVTEGRPAAFVAQIDIGAFHGHGGFDWLPRNGRLYLFFDDWKNGAADSGSLIYSNDAPGPGLEAPSLLPRNRRFAERRIGFTRFMSFPSPDWLGHDWPAGLDFGPCEFAKNADLGGEIEHRIGGYPGEIQGGQMAVECEHRWRGLTHDRRQPASDDILHAARQWRLLLQIDSDPALNMNWWDAGRIYVFIRARDAKRGDFSKTVTITQSY